MARVPAASSNMPAESFVHITFPTARPPTTERMTPQTLITRVCKTEMTGTAYHTGGMRNTIAAAAADTDPATLGIL